MKEPHERLLGTMLMLTFPPIMGFAVAVAFYQNGICLKSLIMLATWLASLCYLWCFPYIQQRLGHAQRVLRDERDWAIFANAALVAHAISWAYFVFAWLVIWQVAGSDGSVSIITLPILFVGGIVVFQWALVVGSLMQDEMSHPDGA